MAIEGYPDCVNGDDNLIYSLVRKIGEGGQGCVFATSDGKRAVKLTFQDCGDEEKSKTRIKKIAALPLWNLAISRPITTIQPTGGYEGYVMDLLTGMMPIAWLMLPEKQLSGEAIVKWFVKETGGIRKRLKVLAAAADTMACLHSLGLVFADPSSANVLVSADPEQYETWLIDPDNIGLEAKSNEQKERSLERGTPIAKSVATPGFCAPELARNESNVNTLTDAFGFAVIVCKTLTLNHPYCGDLVTNGPAEEETKAFAGKHPWIGDQDDQRNKCSTQMAFSLVMTNSLFKLSELTFANGGAIKDRPGMRAWADALYAASDKVVECRHCQATYFPTRNNKLRENCPFCQNERTRFALMKVCRWVPEWTDEAFGETYPGTIVDIDARDTECKVATNAVRITDDACITEVPFSVTRRTAFGARGVDNPNADQTVLTIRADQKKLTIDPFGTNQFLLSVNRNDPEPLAGSREIEWSELPIILHFGPLDRPHRTASFTFE